MSRRRIGLVGAGWVTEYHLRGWAALADRAEIVAFADPSEAARRNRANSFDIAAQFADAAEMLKAASLDAVDIAAPREVHADLVRLGANAGLPILCQKPLAMNLAEAQALVADVGSRVPLMVHENWRFRAWYRELRAWLDQGVGGDIRQVRLDFLSSGMLAGPDGQRAALVRQPFLRSLDRMLVSEILIHHLDTLRFLFGEFNVAWARLERSTIDILGEDIATVLLCRQTDGLPVLVTANLAVHGAPPLPRDQLRILGVRGTMTLNGDTLASLGELESVRQYDAGQVYQDSYTRVLGHFLDGLDRKAAFETAPSDNLKTLDLVEQIYSVAGPIVTR
jgi:predicted dehydrogenase